LTCYGAEEGGRVERKRGQSCVSSAQQLSSTERRGAETLTPISTSSQHIISTNTARASVSREEGGEEDRKTEMVKGREIGRGEREEGREQGN
jgi:hypothetical protein